MGQIEIYQLSITIDRGATNITEVTNHIKKVFGCTSVSLMKPLAGKELKAKATEEAWSNSMDGTSSVINYAAGYREGYLNALKT
jgi:hypothetical protein